MEACIRCRLNRFNCICKRVGKFFMDTKTINLPKKGAVARILEEVSRIKGEIIKAGSDFSKENEIAESEKPGATRCLACFFYLCRCAKGLEDKS